MTHVTDEMAGSWLNAVVRRLLGSERWYESWAHGCAVDGALAVLERAPLLPQELVQLAQLPPHEQPLEAPPLAGGL